MVVTVKREPENMGGPPYEHCCKCGKPTPYWYEKNDVALCQDCAKTVDVKNIPTKEDWFKRDD